MLDSTIGVPGASRDDRQGRDWGCLGDSSAGTASAGGDVPQARPKRSQGDSANVLVGAGWSKGSILSCWQNTEDF